MIDIRRLKELVRLMVENDLSELDLRDEQESVVLRRAMGGMPVTMGPAMAPAPAPSAPATRSGAGDAGDDETGLTAITSPMVGTFYSSPDPESPAYISAGDKVDADTVVCIVEAMKVFSEIRAEVAGVVEKVLVKTGEPVEYGQKLFLVRGA
jgi:acetyl-CoA carboxylase biotin carboxyl carrier protein